MIHPALRSLVVFAALCVLAKGASAQPVMIVVTGASGSDEYATEFAATAQQIIDGAELAKVDVIQVGPGNDGGIVPRDKLMKAVETYAVPSPDPLWLVFIGHGTFDGQKARFNLRGPDVSSAELAGWLEPAERPVIVINCSSSSAPFLTALSGPNRIVVTATQSGYEQNYARFGRFFAAGLTAAEADLDKDDQTSLLEAFLFAATQTAEFYASDERLATEHALIDDNGDEKGTPATFFQGVRVVETPRGGALPDGLRAHQLHLIPGERESRMTLAQRAKRDALELRLEKLRRDKAEYSELEYMGRLEEIVLELATLYQALEPEAGATVTAPESSVRPPAPRGSFSQR